MIISLGVLLIVMFVVIGTTGLCQFNSGEPTQGKVTRVDSQTFLKMEAQSASYPVRDPQVPDGWIPNSARRMNIDGHSGSSVGWVHDKDWIELVQTDAPVDSVVSSLDSKARDKSTTKTVGHTQWTIHTSSVDDSVRPLWIADEGKVRWALSGIATEQEFTQLAEAIESAPVISTTS